MPTPISATITGTDKSCNCCQCCDRLNGVIDVVVSGGYNEDCWSCPENNDFRFTHNITNPNPSVPIGSGSVEIGTLDWIQYDPGTCPTGPTGSGSNPVTISATCDFGTKQIVITISQVSLNFICIYTFDCETGELESITKGTGDTDNCVDCAILSVSIALP